MSRQRHCRPDCLGSRGGGGLNPDGGGRAQILAFSRIRLTYLVCLGYFEFYLIE